MKSRCQSAMSQPQPQTPGLTRRMVKEHAARLYRDVFPSQPLTRWEWRLVEEDLARKLEHDGL